MSASFFQSLREHQVAYLLISGQAAVLYGAATFSEDIDIWITPSPENVGRLKLALRSQRAEFYKLTPPFEINYVLKGHGFHFVLPGEEQLFIDVLGKPPRVETFEAARERAAVMETDWGSIPVIGIKDLVELKKTQRIEDYAVITNLALIHLQQANDSAEPPDYNWVLANVFTLEGIRQLVLTSPLPATAIESYPSLASFQRQVLEFGAAEEKVEETVSHMLQERITELQRLDRWYWRTIIAELRILRAEGKLAPEGAPV